MDNNTRIKRIRFNATNRTFCMLNLLALMAIMSLTSCSAHRGEVENNFPKLSVEQYLQNSVEDTAKLTSAHAHLEALGNTSNSKLLFLAGDLSQLPSPAAQGHIKLKLGGSVIESDFRVLNNVLYFKIYGDTWQSLEDASSVYDISTILNPENGLSHILKSVHDVQDDGSEKINGHYTQKIKGIVAAEALHSLHLDATGQVPVEVWIAKDPSYHLVRASVQTSPGSRTVLDLSQWNDKFTITKPA